MQVTVKTHSNEDFTIEYEVSDTVRTIKEKIAAKDLKGKYEADAMELHYGEKILDDSKTLESYQIKQDSFVRVLKQPPVRAPAASAEPTSPAATKTILGELEEFIDTTIDELADVMPEEGFTALLLSDRGRAPNPECSTSGDIEE